jgi:signal peptidase I
MSETEIYIKHKRKPFLALVLSLSMPGLGHIYCGRIVKGLFFTFLAILPFASIAGMLIENPAKRLLALSAGWLTLSLISLVAVIDSWYTARHTRADYELKEYNRWYVYLLMLLICAAGGSVYALHFRDNYIEAFHVPTASNYPTIVPGDRLLANKLAYITNAPQRGDLVVFTNPKDRRMNFIKRVVAVAGDTVEIKQGRLYINNKGLQCHKLDASVLNKIRIEIQGKVLAGQVYEEINDDAKYKIFLQTGNDPNEDNFAPITVPQYHCFVLGDNRNMSEDSRHFGSIPISAIKGRADYLYYLAKDWSRFGSLRAN